MADGDLSGPAGAAMPAMTLRVNGFPLTLRMKAMGIVGLQFVPGGAAAEFASCPGALHMLPQPVLDYLLSPQPEPLAGSIIERAARALCAIDDVDPDSSLGGDGQNFLWMEYAEVHVKAVLRAIREPDEGMIEAAPEIDGIKSAAEAVAAWQAMIDAALGDG